MTVRLARTTRSVLRVGAVIRAMAAVWSVLLGDCYEVRKGPYVIARWTDYMLYAAAWGGTIGGVIGGIATVISLVPKGEAKGRNVDERQELTDGA